MSLSVTIAIALIALAFAGFCAWRGARPAPVMGRPRLTPWRFLMLAGVAIVVVACVHVVALIRGGPV